MISRSKGIIVKYQGSCHCQNVRFEVETDLKEAMACNCSICARRGHLLAFTPKSAFKLLTDEKALSDYQWGKKSIHFLLLEVRLRAVRSRRHSRRRDDGDQYSLPRERRLGRCARHEFRRQASSLILGICPAAFLCYTARTGKHLPLTRFPVPRLSIESRRKPRCIDGNFERGSYVYDHVLDSSRYRWPSRSLLGDRP